MCFTHNNSCIIFYLHVLLSFLVLCHTLPLRLIMFLMLMLYVQKHVTPNKYFSAIDKFIVLMCLFGLKNELYNSYVIFI
jgi:hypothetical protein